MVLLLLRSSHAPQIMNLFLGITDPLLYIGWKRLLHLAFFLSLKFEIKIKIEVRSITRILASIEAKLGDPSLL